MQTHLWIGNTDTLTEHVQNFIVKHICPREGHGGCFCLDCRQIAQRTHPRTLWLTPSNGYTVEQLSPLFALTRFASDQSVIVIITAAERLNTASANRLLKVLEEPPAHVTFILLTTQEHGILPTLRSRCSIRHIARTEPTRQHELVRILLPGTQERDPLTFDQLLGHYAPDEHMSVALASELLANLVELAKKISVDSAESTEVYTAMATVTHAIAHPPQAGSAPVWWRSLFLALNN